MDDVKHCVMAALCNASMTNGKHCLPVKGQAHSVQLVHGLLLNVDHVIWVILVTAALAHGVLSLAQALHFCLLKASNLQDRNMSRT